jgi:pSer/pThr/pTyr-binding forkhead associated (FHA) protein
VLIVRKGPQPGEKFFLDRATLTLGRDPESDIFLNDMTVSRTHAVLNCSVSGVSVRDSGSLNGTYVNGEVVDSAQLADGDILQVGTFQMIFFLGTGVCE